MLIFPLKKEWYEKIRSGEKTVEYREAKAYWEIRLGNEGCWPGFGNPWDCAKNQKTIPCILRLGYTKRQMTADITKVEVVDGKDTDLRVDKPVYAIHLTNIKEVIQCPECGGSGMMLGFGLGVIECPHCGGDGELEVEK